MMDFKKPENKLFLTVMVISAVFLSYWYGVVPYMENNGMVNLQHTLYTIYGIYDSKETPGEYGAIILVGCSMYRDDECEIQEDYGWYVLTNGDDDETATGEDIPPLSFPDQYNSCSIKGRSSAKCNVIQSGSFVIKRKVGGQTKYITINMAGWINAEVEEDDIIELFLSQPQVCTPEEKRCDGNTVQRCSSDGYYWVDEEVCQYGCSDGYCDKLCTPEEKRCNEKYVEVCSADGYSWISDEYCTYGCDNGICNAPECYSDEDCKSKNLDCFAYCSGGVCYSQENPGCLSTHKWLGYPDCKCVWNECQTDGDCEDDEVCTTNTCVKLNCPEDQEAKDHECVDKEEGGGGSHGEATMILYIILGLVLLGAIVYAVTRKGSVKERVVVGRPW